MWDFVNAEGEDVCTQAVNFQSDQLEMTSRAKTPLFFHIYINDVYIYLDVSKGSILCLCGSVQLAVPALGVCFLQI